MNYEAIKQYMDGRFNAIDQRLERSENLLVALNGRVEKGEDERQATALDVAAIQATCTARAGFSDKEHARLDRSVESNTAKLWAFISDNWQGASTLGVIIYLLIKGGGLGGP